jgi:hypothetical protein
MKSAKGDSVHGHVTLSQSSGSGDDKPTHGKIDFLERSAGSRPAKRSKDSAIGQRI